jgi:hypothetical protein
VFNKKNEEIVLTTFAGVKKNYLTWNQILQIVQGETVEVRSYNRFYRNFQALTVKIKNEVDIKIKANPNKYWRVMIIYPLRYMSSTILI